jgi:hypothetical protein
MVDVMERADLKITVSAVQLRPWPFDLTRGYTRIARGLRACWWQFGGSSIRPVSRTRVSDPTHDDVILASAARFLVDGKEEDASV